MVSVFVYCIEVCWVAQSETDECRQMREMFAQRGVHIEAEQMQRLLQLDQQFSQSLSMGNDAEDDDVGDGSLHCDHAGPVHTMACFRSRSSKPVVKLAPNSNIHGFAP